MQSDWKHRLGIGISLVAIAIFAWRAIPHLTGPQSAFQSGAVLGIAAIVVAVQILHALKLRFLTGGDESFRQLLGACLVSNFFGAFLFTQLAGDVSKVWILNDRKRTGTCFEIAVLRDRFSSLLAVALMLLVALPGVSSLPVVLTTFLSLLAVAAVLSHWAEQLFSPVFHRTASRMASHVPRGWFARFTNLSPWRSVSSGRWFAVHAASLLVQVTGAGAVYYSFAAVGTSLSYTQCIYLACVAAAAVILPLTAGGVGVREISSYSLVVSWGIAPGIAAAGIAQLTGGFLLGTAAGAVLGRLLLREAPRPEIDGDAPSRSPAA